MSRRPPLPFLHGAFLGPEVRAGFVLPWLARRDYLRAAAILVASARPGGCGHGLPIDPSWRSLAWRIAAWLVECGLAARPPALRGAGR